MRKSQKEKRRILAKRPIREVPIFYYHAGGRTKVMIPEELQVKWNEFVRMIDKYRDNPRPTKADYEIFINNHKS